MQYLLTEEEHKALADVDTKVKVLAADYRERLGRVIVDELLELRWPMLEWGANPHSFKNEVLSAFRRAFDKTAVIQK